MLMPALDSAIFHLAQGAFSAPIQTRLGFHIVKVGERRQLSGDEILETKRAIEQKLFERTFEEALATWLTELRRKAFIEIRTAS
jgi:peptidyl-prolyl cis-trans isomerase C